MKFLELVRYELFDFPLKLTRLQHKMLNYKFCKRLGCKKEATK